MRLALLRKWAGLGGWRGKQGGASEQGGWTVVFERFRGVEDQSPTGRLGRRVRDRARFLTALRPTYRRPLPLLQHNTDKVFISDS